MRKSTFLIVCVAVSHSLFAQWTTSGSNVYYNGGNVGIGITSPSTKLHVSGLGGDLNVGNSPTSGDMIIQANTGGRIQSKGAQLEFVIPANSDGSNMWGQGRIMTVAGNLASGNASGKMILGTRRYWYKPGTYAYAWYYGDDLTIDSEGKIGIGTITPAAPLDVGTFINGGTLGTVFGRLSEGNGSGDGTFLGVRGYGTQMTDYSGKSFAIEHSFYGSVNSSINFYRGGGVTGGAIAFNTNTNIEQMRITYAGYVGIGTPNPDAKLAVKGTVHAEEVKVDLSVPGPDYVFDESYPLQSLEEIESYVKQNKHLPDVPSASEMEADGLKVGEMNMLLLRKVEELTLHLIKQNQLIMNQQSEIEKLKSQLK